MNDPLRSSTDLESDTQHSKPNRRGVAAIIVRPREPNSAIPPEKKLLVIRRSRFVEAPGAWCFPGGGIEEQEDEHEAVRRELAEELGVAARPLRRIWCSTTTWRVTISWWLTELPHGATFTLQRQEVEAVDWLSLEQILALPDLLSSNREFLHALQRGRITLDESD